MVRIARNHDIFTKLFLVTYLSFGILLNIFSDKFFETWAEKSNYETNHWPIITAMSGGLFFVDMTMLVLYYITISSIIRFYSKDYHINKVFVWTIVHLVALTYTIEMIWSDLFMWGSIFNYVDFWLQSESHSSFSWIIFSVCTFNSILCTWAQGHIVVAIFTYFGKIKYQKRKMSLQTHKNKILQSNRKTKTDHKNPNSLMSLLPE
jgi:hypothetical protein